MPGMTNRLGRRALLAGLAAAVASPAAALEFRRAPDREFIGQIESALLAFRGRNQRWPADMAELQRFARATRQPLNLSGYKSVTIRPRSATTVYVEYVATKPRREEGGFAVAVVEIAPRR